MVQQATASTATAACSGSASGWRPYLIAEAIRPALTILLDTACNRLYSNDRTLRLGTSQYLKAEAMKPASVAPPSTDIFSETPASCSSSLICEKHMQM